MNTPRARISVVAIIADGDDDRRCCCDYCGAVAYDDDGGCYSDGDQRYWQCSNLASH